MKQIFIVLATALVACNTPNKLHKMMDKLPEASAKECSQRFPIMETTDTLTVYDTALIKAYEMEFGYLYYMLDSLLGKQIPDSTKKEIVTIFQDKKVPVIKYKYITKTQESSATAQVIRDSCQKMSTLLNKKLDKLNQTLDTEIDKVSKLSDKCDRYKRQRNTYLWLLIALIILIIRKPISSIIKLM